MTYIKVRPPKRGSMIKVYQSLCKYMENGVWRRVTFASSSSTNIDRLWTVTQPKKLFKERESWWKKRERESQKLHWQHIPLTGERWGGGGGRRSEWSWRFGGTWATFRCFEKNPDSPYSRRSFLRWNSLGSTGSDYVALSRLINPIHCALNLLTDIN